LYKKPAFFTFISMKNAFILILSILAGFTAYSQKIKVKDGVVYRDDTPLAKMEGKIGLFKLLDLTVKNLNGDTLYTFKRKSYNFRNPEYPELNWYEFNFKKIGRSVKYNKTGGWVREKAVADFLFSDINPPLVKDNDLDTAAINKFAVASDYTTKFEKDTAEKLGYDRALMEHLKMSYMKRDNSKPFVTIQVSVKKNTITYMIRQGDTELGRLYETGADPSKPAQVYKVERRFATPLMYNDKSYEYGTTAYITHNGSKWNFMTIQDNFNKHNFAPKSTDYKYEIILFLASNGFL